MERMLASWSRPWQGALAVALLTLSTQSLPARAVEGGSDAAAAVTAVDYARRGFGFAAGGTSGVGFAWRSVASNGWGYQLGGGLWLPGFNPPQGIWALGLQGIKVIQQSDWWRFYGIAGAQTHGIKRVFYDETGALTTSPDPKYTSPEDRMPFDSILNVGGGVGIEMGRKSGVTLAIELPVVVGLRVVSPYGLAYVMPIPNVLLLYNF